MVQKGLFTVRQTAPSDIRALSETDDSLLTRPNVAWILAFGSVAIGAALSIWPAELRKTTVGLFQPNATTFEPWTTLFWVGTAFWAYLLYRRLKADHQTEDNRLAEVLRAVHRVPNYQVVVSYPDYYQQAADAIARTAEAGGTPEEMLAAIEAGIQVVLTLVAEMAAEFARANEKISYGANIMLVARPGQAGSPFDNQLIDSLRFYDRVRGNPASLRAILYLPEALLLGHSPDRPTRAIPLISLPVPDSPRTPAGHRLALPGAPWALLTGTQSMEEDTRNMAGECSDFAAQMIEDIERYFGDEGDGRDVRSFVSYRIGDEVTPVGVLNIDSNHTHVLGQEPEYYASFYALITPVLRLLRKPVIQYAQLSSSQGQFFRKPTRAAPAPAPGIPGNPAVPVP